jgi:beta-phosphoglucomutase family hydrolase
MNAFIFDMDGVLFANSDFHIEAWIVYARKFGREITEEDVRSRLGWNNRDYMRFVFNREPTDEEVEHSVIEKEEVYRNICRSHLAHPDGLLDLLEAAQAAGIKMGVATSAPPDNIRFTLDGLDIRKYFEVVVDATQVKKSKPDPAIYLKAAELLGVPPEKCIVFEDAIAGIQSGKAAGMSVIAITTSYPAEVLKQHAPDAVIESFTDLAKASPASDVVAHVCGKRVL